MWSGPRNISTAMMRAWENRDDCCVVDEPFYACYLEATGLDHPMREEVLASQPRDWGAVIDQLTAPLPAGCHLQYQKQMTHHMVASLNDEWLGTARHAFLIRDPYEMVASYVAKRGEVIAEDLGLAKAVEVFDRIRKSTGAEPPVIDAGDVLRWPEVALRRLCAALEVPFSDRMLAWPVGPRESDGVWAAHWYNAVVASSGFAPYSPREVELPDHLRSVAEACLPDYEYLRARRLRV